MKAGMSKFPDPHQSPVERQIIKSKTIGNSGAEIPEENFKAKLEANKKISEQRKQSSPEDKAQKAQTEMLERAREMRHLKYDVIDEAAIVQMSVINEDGTVLRKVPQDKIVELVKNIREQKNSKLDVKL